jgi:hypothetical protein
MKKAVFVLLIAILLVFSISIPAFAEESTPAGGCPASFELHQMMDHDHEGEHMHHHIGNDMDQNGDGYLCMKHVGKDGNNHIHIDNDVQLD